MTRMTGPDCAVMGKVINTHTHTHTHVSSEVFVVNIIDPLLGGSKRVWHRITSRTGTDCAVMCNLINTHTYAHTHKQVSGLVPRYLLPSSSRYVDLW